MNALPDSIPARSAAASASRPPRIGKLVQQSFTAMTGQERARLVAMYGVIAGLHVAGFVILFAFVVPSHYKGLGVGVAVLAYTLGLRHAFDADHISAIDNCTRKVLGERQGTGAPRPLGFGFFFSLGHSTVVVAIGAGIVVAEKTVFGAVSDSASGLERFGGLFGTVVSATFLLLIGLLNLVVLAGIVRVFASMRRGEYDEAELERQLANRGFFYRFFGRWMKVITKEWQLYPVGVVFGLGFDTATEVALLATTALLASQHIPWYAIICLPVLFTAGMTLMDTTDGLFMNLAYGWAFFNPVRKVYYNLAITGLSVAICFVIGVVEALSLLPQEIHGLSRTTGFWGLISRFNINTAGFVIVGLFLATWLTALLIWRYARIEQKWSPAPQSGTPGDAGRRGTYALARMPTGDAAGLPLRLSTAAERLAHHRRARVVHGEATHSRLTALAVLEAAGPLRISDLAARTAIGLPAMSRIVERLSRYGWAARHPDPTDHRACLVSITEAGAELLVAMRRERAGRLAPGLAHLQPQQVAALLAALPALEALADRIGQPQGPRHSDLGPAGVWVAGR